jgi:hypothetical protein
LRRTKDAAGKETWVDATTKTKNKGQGYFHHTRLLFSPHIEPQGELIDKSMYKVLREVKEQPQAEYFLPFLWTLSE